MERVRAYRNLHKNCYSVQHYIVGKGWRLLKHVDRIVLLDATYHVSQAGRERTIREGKKCVHAYIEGIESRNDTSQIDHDESFRVSYNPYKAGAFIQGGRHVTSSQLASLQPNGVHAL